MDEQINNVLPDKQKQIAEHITNIRLQAQQLKDKTKSALEQESKEIEEILLEEEMH